MAWKDKMTRKQVTGATYTPTTGKILAFGAVNGASATAALEHYYDDSDDFAVDGTFASGGLVMLPGENHEGCYNKITVSDGIVEVFVSTEGIDND